MKTYKLGCRYINLDQVKTMKEPKIQRNYEIKGKSGFCDACIEIDGKAFSYQNWNEYAGNYYLDSELEEEDYFEQFCQEALAIWHAFIGE